MAFDFAAAHEDKFHDWHDHEHLPERLAVPGFRAVERWIDERNPKVHVATYDLDSAGVLATAACRNVAGDNQSAWTKRMVARCPCIIRFEGEQLAPEGSPAVGGNGLLVASMTPEPVHEAEFNDWYATEHLPRLLTVPGVLGGRRFRATEKDSERKYLSMYHLRDIGVSHSDAWAAASNTPWTDAMRPRLRDLLVLRMTRYQRKATQ